MDEPEKVCLLSIEVLLIVEKDFRKGGLTATAGPLVMLKLSRLCQQ